MKFYNFFFLSLKTFASSTFFEGCMKCYTEGYIYIIAPEATPYTYVCLSLCGDYYLHTNTSYSFNKYKKVWHMLSGAHQATLIDIN